jgi:hypothetical protein
MSLVDSFAEYPKGRTRCALGVIIDGLPEVERTALLGALDDSRFTATVIRSALRDEGLDTSVSTVRTHRRGGCCCDAQGRIVGTGK